MNAMNKNKRLFKKQLRVVILMISFSFGCAGVVQGSDDLLQMVIDSKSNTTSHVQPGYIKATQTLDKEDNLGQIIQAISNESKKNSPKKGIIPAVDYGAEGDFQWGSYLNTSLSSRAAMVVNARTGKVMYQKKPHNRLSLASISKLMTAMVFLDAKQDMSAPIMITEEDVDRLKNSGSRLAVGTVLTRQELLHIGLMSSENRAIHALARNYSGGESAFVAAMNAKARQLGMHDTVFYEPTGLDPRNKSTAADIIKMAQAADRYPLIRYYTTDQQTQIRGKSGKMLTYKNSNSLVRDGQWQVGLQKTGYIREAGRCMVVKSRFGNDDVYLVFLGAPSSYSRVSDAEQVREVFGGGRYY